MWHNWTALGVDSPPRNPAWYTSGIADCSLAKSGVGLSAAPNFVAGDSSFSTPVLYLLSASHADANPG